VRKSGSGSERGKRHWYPDRVRLLTPIQNGLTATKRMHFRKEKCQKEGCKNPPHTRRNLMHLEEFVESEKKRIEDFKEGWEVNNSYTPDNYPMDMSEEDWIEQLQIYEHGE
jgi:hypothetical protein